jgi:hypothetical protein
LFPTEWKNKVHVPNHQPEIVSKNPVFGAEFKIVLGEESFSGGNWPA